MKYKCICQSCNYINEQWNGEHCFNCEGKYNQNFIPIGAKDEQEPCGDTISRQAILDLCHNHINGTVDVNDIARLPAVTPAERATYRKKAKRWKNKYMKLKSEIAKMAPCDLCKYSPPSAGDNKPCTMCPAERSDKE